MYANYPKVTVDTSLCTLAFRIRSKRAMRNRKLARKIESAIVIASGGFLLAIPVGIALALVGV